MGGRTDIQTLMYHTHCLKSGVRKKKMDKTLVLFSKYTKLIVFVFNYWVLGTLSIWMATWEYILYILYLGGGV
jgi:hypothetical protein